MLRIIMAQRNILLPEKQQHYLEKDDLNRCVYHKQEMDATERTAAIMQDAEELISICNQSGELDDTSEYQLLIGLMKERTAVDGDGTRRLRPKEEVENSSKVLLSPSNPEDTFHYKAGKDTWGMLETL